MSEPEKRLPVNKGGRIIINIGEGVHHDEALYKIIAVVNLGLISADGKSYSYGASFGNLRVFTREPRKGSETHTFYIYRQD